MGGRSAALGLLQIPPLDLRQAEVIKGAATALYGPAGLGGVVNLVSRSPSDRHEILVNQTSRSGTDAVVWLGKRLNDRWGYTVIGGAHHQDQVDANGDGWADLPGFERVELRSARESRRAHRLLGPAAFELAVLDANASITRR